MRNIKPSYFFKLMQFLLLFFLKIDEKCIVMKKRKKGKHLVELTQNGLPTTWFVFTKEIKMAVSILTKHFHQTQTACKQKSLKITILL